MESKRLEAGTYAIINVRLPRWVLDTKDGVVVAYPYISSPSQQWNLESSDGICWYIKNVASGRYLGLPVDERVKNALTLREVDHKFAWHLRRFEDKEHQFLPYVPYTNYVIDLDPRDPQPGRTLYVHEDGKGPHQAWHFTKDLHLETSRILQDGRRYKILNAQSNTAITVKDDRTVACFQSDHREGQMFQAVETANGWAFRSVKTKQYLGIPHTIVYPVHGPRLTSVEKEFTWMVLPYYDGSKKFKIWLPFTRMVLDLHHGQKEDDTPIHIWGTTSVEYIWWRFEEVLEPWGDNKSASEDVTGERDPGV
ncbi:hypothetical protein BKA70DRAFT_1285906 [Coprinopsis sp. MPI-PUGE-AT-0042]|nr:hypothetical protein BKA70DRAFT_1285906 [Coprinopsis sp. MPI-PUGE-AT-0042]